MCHDSEGSRTWESLLPNTQMPLLILHERGIAELNGQHHTSQDTQKVPQSLCYFFFFVLLGFE